MSLLAWPGIKPIDAVGTSAVFILLGWALTALIGLAVTTNTKDEAAK
jgi:hypothetical protein